MKKKVVVKVLVAGLMLVVVGLPIATYASQKSTKGAEVKSTLKPTAKPVEESSEKLSQKADRLEKEYASIYDENSVLWGEVFKEYEKAIDENIVVVEDKKEGEDYKLVEVEKKEITLEEVIEKSDSFSETEKEKLRKDIGKMNDLEEQLTDIYEKINE